MRGLQAGTTRPNRSSGRPPPTLSSTRCAVVKNWLGRHTRTSMSSSETRMQIRHWFYAEHWKIGTIAQALGIHADTLRSAIESNRFHRAQTLRPCLTDPYLPFIRQALEQYPQSVSYT